MKIFIHKTLRNTINVYWFVQFTILISCGVNTMNVTSLHQNPIRTDKPQTNIKEQLFKPIFEYDYSMSENDTIQETMKINYSEEIPFVYRRIAHDLKLKSQFGTQGFHYTFGFGIGEGYLSAFSFTLFDAIQAHIWGSSWVFGNHKFGSGVTVSTPNFNKIFDKIILGYGISRVNAYAIGCEGSCGLGGFPTIQGEISTFQHIFETSLRFSHIRFFAKLEIGINYSYELMAFGVRWRIP